MSDGEKWTIYHNIFSHWFVGKARGSMAMRKLVEKRFLKSELWDWADPHHDEFRRHIIRSGFTTSEREQMMENWCENFQRNWRDYGWEGQVMTAGHRAIHLVELHYFDERPGHFEYGEGPTCSNIDPWSRKPDHLYVYPVQEGKTSMWAHPLYFTDEGWDIDKQRYDCAQQTKVNNKLFKLFS